jgi:REP element-mobilizing transposase RayT
MDSSTSARPAAQNRDRQGASQSTYLITFVCYGSWLPGQAGAVDRTHNLFGSRLPDADRSRQRDADQRMRQPPYLLDITRRRIVLAAILEVCVHRNWNLVSVHVRSNHVHVVIAAGKTAEHVMNALKAYASRALNRMVLDGPDRRRWAHHGSTRHLWTKEALSAAVRYVVCEQGEPMEVWELPMVQD